MWNIRSKDPDMSIRRSWNVLLSHPAVRYPAPPGYPDQLHPDSPGWKELCRKGDRLRTRCRDPSPGWHEARKAIRINSIWISQEDMWRASLSGLLQGEAHDTREHHTRTITYPIRICCPDHWLKLASLATSFRQPATAHVPPPSDGVSGRPIRISLPWIPKNSPQSRIALVIKKLSK